MRLGSAIFLLILLEIFSTSSGKYQQKCGVAPLDKTSSKTNYSNYAKRIVGGTAATKHSHPWVVRLQIWDKGLENGKPVYFTSTCGGTLISSCFILTAAHCIGETSSWYKYYKVILGDHDQYAVYEANHVTRGVKKIYIHPKYNQSNHDNDIALIKLSQSVGFEDHIQPACLPSAGEYKDPPALKAWVVGWGHTKEGGKGADILMEAKLPLLSHRSCTLMTKHRKRKSFISNNMLCAGGQNVDACQGDSGGPLLIRNSATRQFEVHGVVSWGVGCARRGYPGLYAKVHNYLGWIKGVMHGKYSK
ncbi:chymotrypsin-like elastase family member 2A [Neocloeon triangulifer]|uniref:chymotrypsin-like elastase family member 2A n=1 Tax=Neocloeon triangulifer TaxID=2078957 RepID=UPI00286ED30C|nr:chymotrypsin-like elastase family member 2A [Neocloeon triangulifer]